MPASIGVNLRVTGHCRQGGRKYMEDFFSVAYQQTEDEKDLEYAFFGIYDGHGGAEAAAFAKEHLMETIIKHKNFWSDDDEDVLRAIKDGYIATHYAMWREQEKWPKTASGLPSTAGTTASIAFIRRGKIYIGHVGDSGIVLGYQEPGSSDWKAKPLTRDHKPENAEEMSRIEQCGGKVVAKSGVPRVVWNRPRIGHQGPVRRSTPIDEIPFLAVARSLGDLWSYNSQIDRFVVSPQPDCLVLEINTDIHRCLIFGTDGLYNMLSAGLAVHIVQQAERHNENAALSDSTYKTGWLNPSKLLVENALERWHSTKMRADNTSAVTLMLDPPGPPRAQVLKDRKKNLPERGLKIMTRFDEGNSPQDVPADSVIEPPANNNNCDDVLGAENEEATVHELLTPVTIIETPPEPVAPLVPIVPQPKQNSSTAETSSSNKDECLIEPILTDCTPVSSSDLNTLLSSSSCNQPTCSPLKERNHHLKPRESTSFDPRAGPPETPSPQLQRNPTPDGAGKENVSSVKSASNSPAIEDSIIQCNEVSSSNIEADGEETDVMEKKLVKRTLRSSTNSIVESVESKLINTRKKRESSCEAPTKRKNKSEMEPASPRKSLRIDSHQKRTIQSSPSNSKKVPETPLVKKHIVTDLNNPKPKKISQLTPKFAQKTLKCKNAIMKKKDIIKKSVVSKKKLQLMLERVKNVQKPKLPKLAKERFVKVKKLKTDKPVKTQKIVVTKVAFLRQSKQTASQRYNFKASNKENKKVSTKHAEQSNGEKSSSRNQNGNFKESKSKRKAKADAAVKRTIMKEDRPSLNVRNRAQMNISISPVLKKEAVSSTSLKKTPTKKTPKTKKEVTTTTLRKRLQQKTENLRRNVMRKK